MLRHIFKYEWKKLTGDKSLWMIGLIVAMTTCIAIYNGKSWVDFQQRTLERIQLAESSHLNAIQYSLQNDTLIKRGFYDDYESPGTIAYTLYRYAGMQPKELALLSIGQSDIYPYYFGMTGLAKQQLIANEIQNPLNLLIGKLDFAFFIIYLLPLLIIALSFDLLSSEKEKGTLRLLQTYHVSIYKVILYKMMFRYATLNVWILICLLCCLLPADVFLLKGSVLSGLILLNILIMAYSLFWFGLAFFINTSAQSSSTRNGIIMTGFWLLFLFIIPALINMVITVFQPVPSQVSLITKSREAAQQANAESTKLLADYYQDHPELAMLDSDTASQAKVDDFWFKFLAVKDNVEKKTGPVQQDFDEKLQTQQALVTQFRFLSPALIMSESLNDLSGTNLRRYNQLFDAVETFFQTWKDYILPRIFKKQKLVSDDFDQLPQFQGIGQQSKPDIIYYLLNLVALLVPSVLLILGSKKKLESWREFS